MLGQQWPADTQEIEGCNNILKHITETAPNRILPLTSSRILIKQLDMVRAGDETQREHVQKLIHRAVDDHALAMNMMPQIDTPDR